MDQGPLVTEQIKAGEKFIREFAKYTSVRTAFWLKATEDNQWFLYLAGDQIDDSNFHLAYREVIRIARTNPDPWLDPFHVKVMGAAEPIPRDVLKIQEQYPEIMPMRYHGPPLGDLCIEEVYIYPLEIGVPA